MFKWKRPSGSIIETNETDASVEAAAALGWKPYDAADTVELDVRGLPWDARLNTKNKAKHDNGKWKYKKGINADLALPVEIELLDS